MIYKDQTEADFQHLKLMRNRAGEYMAKNNFNLAFEAVLDLQRDINKRKLHPSTFDFILDEIIAIGTGLNDDPMIAVKFGAYIAKNFHKLDVKK